MVIVQIISSNHKNVIFDNEAVFEHVGQRE
nr:MAG TPA: hypothetical protein [Bacteriophage sp.]